MAKSRSTTESMYILYAVQTAGDIFCFPPNYFRIHPIDADLTIQ